jgi:hypothetical protein
MHGSCAELKSVPLNGASWCAATPASVNMKVTPIDLWHAVEGPFFGEDENGSAVLTLLFFESTGKNRRAIKTQPSLSCY